MCDFNWLAATEKIYTPMSWKYFFPTFQYVLFYLSEKNRKMWRGGAFMASGIQAVSMYACFWYKKVRTDPYKVLEAHMFIF